jgi:hypothetical protein
MSRLVYFCAGVRKETLPATKVKNILINVLDNGENEKAINNTRIIFKGAGTETSMLDSGGYQIHVAEKQNKKMTFDPSLPMMRSDQGINISPLHVVNAACKLQPTIVTALDFPLRRLPDRTDQEQEFRRKLGFNMTWALETASLREKYCPDIQLFIPVQCYNLNQFEIFENSISHTRHDGLSLPIRSLRLPEIALFFFRFYQVGIRKVHILGTSSFFVTALAAFFARHFFEWVSFDSTTWRESAQHEIYLNPLDLSPERIGKEVLIDERIPILCQCPFCANTTFTFIKNLPYAEKVDLLRNHNFYVIEKATEDLFAKAGNLLSLEKYLKNCSPKNKEIDELIESLSIINLSRNEDIHVLKPFFEIAA